MKYAVITDSNVAALYGKENCFVVPAGESSKSIQIIEKLACELVQKGYGRDTVIVGLGGGMICDLAGFLASIFCRGVPLILIPTTLLAMVDASIGGKTAVNVPEGKNLLGSTIFPEKVILHLPFLETLPDAEWENGIIEILKVGLLFDPDLFFHFSDLSLSSVIERAIEAKRRIVAQDPYDKGCRALLNFGHTIGHALESLSNYTLPHGKAVAAGIVIEARLSHVLGFLPSHDLDAIENHFPPLRLNYEPEKILAKLSSDKKAKGGVPHFILLKSIGEAYVKDGCFSHPVDTALLTKVLNETCLCSR
ncbi:MAG: 3-dehydroquinate synthase [Rhabdochlamydiaceae bacterium]|nr:3-dehydroquinate synthase [Rhabdochlamydiaceae bacterium]